jgi:hypothetical protein
MSPEKMKKPSVPVKLEKSMPDRQSPMLFNAKTQWRGAFLPLQPRLLRYSPGRAESESL